MTFVILNLFGLKIQVNNRKLRYIKYIFVYLLNTPSNLSQQEKKKSIINDNKHKEHAIRKRKRKRTATKENSTGLYKRKSISDIFSLIMLICI